MRTTRQWYQEHARRHFSCMAHSISESSHGSVGTTSSSIPSPVGDFGFWQLWHRWRPGWYVLVFAVNATAAALLFPVAIGDDDSGYSYFHDHPLRQLTEARIYFSVLMLASLGSGCMTAFLKKRAGASAHVRSASGYATVNWSQSLLATITIRHGPVAQYGFLPQTFAEQAGLQAVCRGMVYMLASVWMQKLIASRLELLEVSSGQAFGGHCVRRLVRVQACTSCLTIFLCCMILFGPFWYDPWWKEWGALMAGLTAIFNVLASMMAACSLTKSFLALRRVLSVAKLTDASVAAQLSLGRARRLAGLQTMGVSCSLVLTILVIPFSVLAIIAGDFLSYQEGWGVIRASVTVQAMDVLGNSLAALLLSGSHRLQKVDQVPGQQLGCWACHRQTKAPLEKPRDWSPTWRAKVEELSLRGMTLRSLLCFYQEMLLPMPGWKYTPKDHKTRDVVRRAIIPLTSREESAYAVSALNRDGPQRAQVMVTHNWGNCRQDLN